MKSLNVAVLSKCFSDEIFDIIDNVIREVRKYAHNVVMLSEYNKFFHGSDITFLTDLDTLMQKSDLIFVIGGDGTLIYYAKKAAKLGKKVFGINGGNLGFLCGCERYEIDKIDEVLNGRYKLNRGMMLEVNVNDKVFTAFNDVVLTRDINSPILQYDICKGDEIVCSYESDGVILATPMGSTAYSFSAGGAIVESDMECVVVTPICPHSFFSRSMIIKADKEITVNVRNQTSDECGVHVSVDGTVYSLNLHELNGIKIKKSKYSANIICLTEQNFYDNIEKKLIRKSK